MSHIGTNDTTLYNTQKVLFSTSENENPEENPGEDLQWKGEDLQCCRSSGERSAMLQTFRGEGLQYNTGTKIVKRLRRLNYVQVIIERTICLVLGPSTALPVHIFPLSVELRLTNRFWLYDGACPNLLRGDRVLTDPPNSVRNRYSI